MPTTPYLPPPPTTQGSNLSQTDYQWLLIVQGLAAIYEVDTSAGSYSEALPAAGVGSSGQTGQCKEIIYLKTSADANGDTITGAKTGSVTLTAQNSYVRFKSDGTNWYQVGGTISIPPSVVTSVFGRTGAVIAANGDYTVAEVTGAAPLASPAFTGTPTAPTAAALTDDTQIATTAYTDAAVAVETSRAEAAESTLAAAVALKAPLASPALTGTPTAPTPAAFDGSTKLATTAYVDAEVAEVVSAPDYAGIPCDYWVFIIAAATSSQSTSAANTYFVFFTLQQTVTFTKMTIFISIAANGDHLYVGIYNKAQTSLIVQGTFPSTASTGVVRATVTQTTLKPGTYCLAFTTDVTSSVRALGVPQSANGAAIWNNTNTKSGFINNPPVAGVMPANLLSSGSVTANGTIVPPFVLLEP